MSTITLLKCFNESESEYYSYTFEQVHTVHTVTFIFMNLANTFIQNDLH